MEEKTFIKKIVILSLIITVVILIVNFGFSSYQENKFVNLYNDEGFEKEKEEVKKHNEKAEEHKIEYINTATINATKYIENKYGFTPELFDAYAEYTTLFVGAMDGWGGYKYNYTGNVRFKFIKNEKEYYVLISGNENDLMGYDNFQRDDILLGILNAFYQDIGQEPYDYNIKYGKTYGEGNSLSEEYTHDLVNVYYDGNNLSEVLIKPNIFIEYGNEINLSEIKNTKLSFLKNDAKVLIVKYKSKEEYILAKSNYDGNNDSYSVSGLKHKHDFVNDEILLGYDLVEKSLNIDSYLLIDDNLRIVENPKIAELDGIYIVQYRTTKEPQLTPSTTEDVSKTDWVGYANKIEKISGSYSMETEDANVLIYYPIDKIENYEVWYDTSKRLYIGLQYSESEFKDYFAGYNATIIESNGIKYLVFEVDKYLLKNRKDTRFVLLGIEY